MKQATGVKKYLNWEMLGVPIILLLFSFMAYSAEPRFIQPSNILNLLGQTSILALAAYGQAFVIICGGLDISIGSLVAVTAVITTLVARDYGTLIGFGAGIASGALLGYINGFNITRIKIQPVIATIAMLNFARGLAFVLSDGQPILDMPEGFSVLGFGKSFGFPNRITLAVLILLAGQFFLTRVKSGRNMFAVGGDEEASRVSGINPVKYKTLAYVLAGIMAALTGIVISGRANSGQPTIGVFLELSTIAAVVIGGVSLGGGRGNLVRTFAGAMIITILSNGMNMAGVSPYMQEMAIGVVIILAVLIDKIRFIQEVRLGKYVWKFH